MDKTLDFFQICFKEEHREHCYPFAKVLFREGNPGLFFENAVIAEIVSASTADVISVASWRLAAKRADGPVPIILKNQTGLTEEKILQADFDVAILTPRNHKDVRFKLLMWHGMNGNEELKMKDALREFDKFFKIPEIVDRVIYENHFIANGDLYREYVSTMLIPAMEFMKEREVFAENSGYITKKQNKREIIDYQQKSGRKDWPIAPFILERLFCSWIQGKGLKIINL